MSTKNTVDARPSLIMNIKTDKMNLTINRLLDNYFKRFKEPRPKGINESVADGYYQISNVEKIEIKSDWIELNVLAEWKPSVISRTTHSTRLVIQVAIKTNK